MTITVTRGELQQISNLLEKFPDTSDFTIGRDSYQRDVLEVQFNHIVNGLSAVVKIEISD